MIEAHNNQMITWVASVFIHIRLFMINFQKRVNTNTSLPIHVFPPVIQSDCLNCWKFYSQISRRISGLEDQIQINTISLY